MNVNLLTVNTYIQAKSCSDNFANSSAIDISNSDISNEVSAPTTVSLTVPSNSVHTESIELP